MRVPPETATEIALSVECCETSTATPPLPVVPLPLAEGSENVPVAAIEPPFTAREPARISMPSAPETVPPLTVSVPSPGK